LRKVAPNRATDTKLNRDVAVKILPDSFAADPDWVRSDHAGNALRLLERPELPRPWSFSPDGRRLAYFEKDLDSGYDI